MNVLAPHRFTFLIIRLIACAFLLWAPAHHPIGFYTALRIGVCGTALYGAYLASSGERMGWFAAFLILAFFFNPLAKALFARETWICIDLFSAAFLAVSIALFPPVAAKVPKAATPEGEPTEDGGTRWLTRKIQQEDVSLDGSLSEEYRAFFTKLRDGDELWEFREEKEEFGELSGAAGMAIVRDREIAETLITVLT